MGRKVLQASVALSFIASALTIFSITQPVHSSVFSIGIPVIRMDLSLRSVSFSMCGGGMFLDWALKKVTDMCHKVPKENDLQEFSQTTCTGAVKFVFPDMCAATERAYLLGAVVLIGCIVNVILQLVAAIMAYQYIEGSVKKQYRQVWSLLIACGTFIQFCAIVFYYVLAARGLDGMATNPALGLTGLSHGKGVGVKPAFLMLFIAVILQIIALVLTNFAKVGREKLEEERRENRKFMEEVNMYNEAADAANSMQGGTNYSGYGAAIPQAQGPQSYAGYGQGPDSFGLPAAQPAMGMQQPGVQQPVMQPAW